MNENDRPTHRTVMASALQVDDSITNLGVVESTTRVWAFVLVQVRTPTWSLATGLATMVTNLHLFHAADGVVIDLV